MENNEGSISFAIRLLGNEVVGFEMKVDSLRTKWLVLSIGAVAVLTWIATVALPIIKEYSA